MNQLPILVAAPPSGALADLYAKLSPFQGQSLDLVAELPAGRIASFLGPLGGTSTFVVAGANVTFADPYAAVTVSGTFAGLGLGTLTVTVSFTVAADGKTLVADVSLDAALAWTWPLAPWLSPSGPSIEVQISDSAAVPASGTLGLAVGAGDPKATVAFQAPGPTPDSWLLTGTFPPATSISHLFELLGGVNLSTSLPSPLNDVSALSLEQVSIVYSPKTRAIAYMAAQLGATVDWPLLPNGIATVTGIGLQVAVDAPATSRALSWLLTGTIAIGASALVDVQARYPHALVSATLDPSTTLSLSDFVSRFIDHPVELAATVTSFDLNVAFDAPHAYEIAAEIDTDWPIPIADVEAITITGIGFRVAGDDSGRTGMIRGTTVIGKVGDPTASVTFVVAADYADPTKGWVFSAKQTQGTIPLVQLVSQYLPSGWAPDPASNKLNIEDLSVTLAPKPGSYAIAGKADASWDILGGFALQASATVAFDGVAKAYTGKIEATLDKAFGVSNLGLHLSYSFSPKTTAYELDWQGLTGTYTVPSDPNAHRILKIVVEGWTLGRLIEELVSLATGARFSLASPWDLLDEIPLDCTLEFDITAGSVSFTYPLSIDLGIAAVSGISVTYDPKAQQKVAVALQGRFPWQTDDPSKPLGWDATKPETTPAPPGGGSKYLELRVLGLGQHVALTDPPKDATVTSIVESVGELATPPSDELPIEGTAIEYSQASSWLVAADFGILKLDPPPKSGSAYFLDMALVFNDPNLYGLHVELEGSAAKIFAGLQFDILYRKVTDTIGVYQAQLQLPTAMRQFDVGAFSFTLPTFGVSVYTNGDFELDIGFPWNNDFSRSFTVQGIVPPGIPVIGSGGFYFGKLSAETAGSNVPATTKGTFNPVIVFGIGLQLGVGKTIEKGPLKAGLTVTVLGIVQGVIARWHPYLPDGDSQGGDQLQGPYYFKLQGTVGVAAHLFGSIDFAVIKASVDVSLQITVQLTYESYRAIPITVSASVDVAVSLSIDLGLFTIHLHFSFSTSISETFTVGHDELAPWDGSASLGEPAADLRTRGRRLVGARNQRLLAGTADGSLALTWTNLQAPATPLSLDVYCAPAFTVVGDGATTPAQQQGAYVLLLWIASVDPNAGPTTGPDTSFEALAKQVLRWAVAAGQSGPVAATAVDDLVVSADTLEQLLAALADPTNSLPIAPSDVDTFLQRNAKVGVTAPTTAGSATATYFPIPPQVQVSAPSVGVQPYTIGDFNAYGSDYIAYLQRYFSALDVQVQEETGGDRLAADADDGIQLSIGSFVYADYMTMIARHMLEAARDALRDLKLPVPSGQTVQATIDAINATGDLDPQHRYTAGQLFEANASQPLTPGLSVHVSYAPETGATLTSVAQRYAGPLAFSAAQVATANQAVPDVLVAGTSIQYPGKPAHVVVAGERLADVAAAFGVAIADLIASSDVTTAALTAGVPLLLPVAHGTVAGDTLGAIAASFGVPVAALGDPATANAALTGLFALGDTPQRQFLNVPHLPQYRLGDLIEEAQASLAIQRLSGMLGRYFLHGVRLPTDTTGSSDRGLFALTGQQLPLGTGGVVPFDIDLSCPDAVTWLQLG